MNREEIIKLAKQAVFETYGTQPTVEGYICTEELEHFANLVAAKEREECTNVCDEVKSENQQWKEHMYDMKAHGTDECADAIRKRGEK